MIKFAHIQLTRSLLWAQYEFYTHYFIPSFYASPHMDFLTRSSQIFTIPIHPYWLHHLLSALPYQEKKIFAPFRVLICLAYYLAMLATSS